MSEQITSQEFWDEVSAIADQVLTEYEHGVVEDIDSAISELEQVKELEELEERVAGIIQAIDDINVDSLDDVEGKLHELVDGHEWVIYYHSAWGVAYLMRADDNACGMFKEIGCIQPGESLDNLMCQFCYYALYSNAAEEMGEALDRWRASKKTEVETIADNLRR